MANTAGADHDLGLARPRERLMDGHQTTDWARRADVFSVSALAAAAGMGLMTVALADTVARSGSSWASPWFWAGMLMIWMPITLRIVEREATRSERIALLVLLGMAIYVVKILNSPRYFVGYDEFLHWRTAEDIVRTGTLFDPNPVLPISPSYPGLEIATSAITELTGLSVFVAGTLVVGAARLIMILALYLLYERVSGSAWVAGVATAVYFTCPQFLFFDAAYGYESLSLPLALLVLCGIARRRQVRGQRQIGATLLIILPLAAMVVTHHVTAFLLVITLLLLATFAVRLDHGNTRLWLWGIALIATGFVLLWRYLVAGRVIDYLEPPVSGALSGVVDLVSGQGVSRQLFHGYAGPTTPPLDVLASFAFTAITVFALALGWLHILRTRRFDALTVVFAVGALAYPASGLLHFTTFGAELATRLLAFVFVPVAFCIALGVSAARARRFNTAWVVALVSISGVLLYGGVVTGSASWSVHPGPYLVSADSRSIEAEGISAASWAASSLGPGNRIAADRINTLLMATYGDQLPVATVGPRIGVAPVFFSRELTPYERGLLRRGSVPYLVVDYRLTRSLPWLGIYYDNGEPGAYAHRRPIPTAAFAKFDRMQGASRVFDSGNIVIFDIKDVARGG